MRHDSVGEQTSLYRPRSHAFTNATVRSVARSGKAAHAHGLIGSRLPSIELQNFDGSPVELRHLAAGWLVVYCYPGHSEETASQLEDEREHRAYRRHEQEFQRRRIRVAAVSTQPCAEQFRTIFAHDIRHAMLCDTALVLARRLELPVTETGDGRHRYGRMTLLIRQETIEHVFYPVRRGEANPEQVLAWMAIHGR